MLLIPIHHTYLQVDPLESFHEGHLLESETYIGTCSVVVVFCCVVSLCCVVLCCIVVLYAVCGVLNVFFLELPSYVSACYPLLHVKSTIVSYIHTTPHHTTLHCTALHYSTLHHTYTTHTLHHTILHYTILHYTTLHHTTPQAATWSAWRPACSAQTFPPSSTSCPRRCSS